MTQFRYHRGSLEDSMSTVMVVMSKTELFCRLKPSLQKVCRITELSDLDIQPYDPHPDLRINWPSTWIVLAKGWHKGPSYWTPIGFTDGPLD